MRFSGIILLIIGVCTNAVNAQNEPEQYLSAGIDSELPQVFANTNKIPAGTFQNGQLQLNLEITKSDFRPETHDRPGVRLWAFNEVGEHPSIPAPLLRVEVGTVISVSLRNNHPDSILYVYGLNKKGDENSQTVNEIAPEEIESWSFTANEIGTYFYYAEIGINARRNFNENEQLAGAFIIDEVGASTDDEIIVLNIFSQNYDSTYSVPSLEALTMNGKSWPFSQMFTPNVGDSLTWRIINASDRNHPMHLHGFYYDVESNGNAFKDDIYDNSNIRTVVTEFMRRRTTMKMRWVPKREGKWLFHCHLSFHVSPEVRLPGADEKDDHNIHMAGLVVGIDVQPGPSDLISHGETRKMTLYVKDYPKSGSYKYSFSLDENYIPDSTKQTAPGPLLVMKQYQTTDVKVVNQMNQPTGIHWHGLELDSWADGVPNFSASDGKMSPVIEPGKSFVYRLSHLRAGTFIYHSHLNDVDQLTGGLYGPLIVLPANQEYDSKFDHIYTFQWLTAGPNNLTEYEVNGVTLDQPLTIVEAKTGEEHRLRLINIAPAGRIKMFMKQDSTFIPLKVWAKDGADLPETQRVLAEQSKRIGVGETIDYIFKPEKSGIYELYVGRNEFASAKQKWIVSD